MGDGMDVEKKEALDILQGAFKVDQDDSLKGFKTKYKKWLLRGNHPDTGGTGQNFDRVRQAYHVYVTYLTPMHKEGRVCGDPINYEEFSAESLAKGNYCAAFTSNLRALSGIPFEHFYADWKK
jgi:hypothetical protein